LVSTGNLPVVLAGLWAAVLFLHIYGPWILNPFYTDWLLVAGQRIDPDVACHQLGWAFYRQAPWLFPPGMADTLAHPFPSSIILTDSIPLLAVGFKLLSPVLPEDFQYFGLWGILCFILHGTLGALLLRKYLQSPALIVLGSTFFTLNWVVLFRLYRFTALSAQWHAELALILLVYYEEVFHDWRKAALAWGGLGILCASTHVYILPMVGALLCAFLATHLVKGFRSRHLRPLLLHLLATLAPLLSYLGCAFTTIALLGGFTSPMAGPGKNTPHNAFNLNGFFNPFDRGALLRTLPTHDGEMLPEGYAYLGAGLLVLVLVAVAALAANLRWSDARKACSPSGILPFLRANIKVVSLGVVALGLVLLASLPAIHLGQVQVLPAVSEDFLAGFYGAFRAKGRLVWPVLLLFMLFGLCADRRFVCPRFKTVLVIVCLALQFVDLEPEIRGKQAWFKPVRAYESPLRSPVWREIAISGQVRHLVLMSGIVDQHKFRLEYFFALADYASRHHLTLNDFIFARGRIYEREADRLQGQLLAHPDPDTLFILDRRHARERFRYPGLRWSEVDDLYLGHVDGSFFEGTPKDRTVGRPGGVGAAGRSFCTLR